MYWLLELGRANLHVLMANGGDAVSFAILVKGMIEHGSYLANPSVGAPGGLQMLDFPTADGLHMLILRVLGMLTGDVAVTVNLYYLMSYPLAALASVFVLRRFSASRVSALLASVLFAFVPYHYLRGLGHLSLAAYYSVPFIIMLALAVDSKTMPFFVLGEDQKKGYRFAPFTVPSMGFAVLAVLIGLSGVYYAFFACFFFLVTGVLACVRRKAWKRLASAGILVGFSAIAFGVQMIPSWWYHLQNGPNALAGSRQVFEADMYAFRLSQLVLPLAKHRFPAFSGLFTWYWTQIQLTTGISEASMSALGLIGATGFIVLVGWLLFSRFLPGREVSRFTTLMDSLSVLNMSGFLLGTAGGLGAVFAIVAPSIRAYNRISIIIAFICLFAMALIFDRLIRLIADKEVANVVALVACACILLFGVLDQVSPANLVDYELAAANAQNDAGIVGQVEKALPPGSLVFQLPVVQFPESPPVVQMPDYQHFRAALQSKTLRWSYGTMKGRPEDAWQQRVGALPAPEMIAELKSKGFSAVWVDRAGYQDSGAAIDVAMAQATASQPIVSQNGEFAVYLFK